MAMINSDKSRAINTPNVFDVPRGIQQIVVLATTAEAKPLR